MEDARQVAEIILRISPESDGEISHRLFKDLEEQTGLDLGHLVEGDVFAKAPHRRDRNGGELLGGSGDERCSSGTPDLL